MTETWFIAGAAGGLGQHLVSTALKAGRAVLAADIDAPGLAELTARESAGADDGRLATTTVDLADFDATGRAVHQAESLFGRLDAVINTAGYRGVGSIEDMSAQEWHRTIDTNLFGGINLVRAALPLLRPRRRGYFLQVSTIGGRRAQPGLGAYQTAAWGIGGFFEILARELAPLGLYATLLELGGVRTPRAQRLLPTTGWHADYESTVGRFVQAYQHNQDVQRGDPAKIADVILRLTTESAPPSRLLLGSDAAWLAPRIAAARASEDAAWQRLTMSIDCDDLPDFSATEVSQMVRPVQTAPSSQAPLAHDDSRA